MCIWHGSLWPKHPGSYFRRHLSRRHLLADGSGGLSPLALVHHCTCDTINVLLFTWFKFSHTKYIKKIWKQTFQYIDYLNLGNLWDKSIVCWFLSTNSVIQKISRNLVFFFWSTFFESKYSTSILVLKLFEVKHKLPLHEAIQKVKAGSISWGPGTVCPQFIISEGVTAWVTIPMSQTIPGGVCMGSIHLGQKQTALWPWGSEKGKTQINSL